MEIDKPDLHAMGFAAIIDLGVELLGEARLNELLVSIGTTRARVTDATAWFSLEFAETLLERLVNESGKQDLIEVAAQRMLSRRYLGPTYPLYRAFGSPAFTYTRVVPLVRLSNKTGYFEVADHRRGYVRLTWRSHPTHHEAKGYMCRIRFAQMRLAPTMFDLPEAKVEHSTCITRGDDACVYLVQWQEAPARMRAWFGAALGAGFGASLTYIPLIEHTQLGLLALLGAVAGWGMGRVLELQRIVAERDADIADHQQAVTRSEQNAERRYEELLESKAEVDKKVEQRTAELQQTSQRLSETLSELQALDRTKTDFFNNVSHELRSPLTLILGPLEDLVVGREPAGGTPSALQAMHRSASRLLQLINQLLDLAKIDAGKMSISRVHADLAMLARALTNHFQVAAARKQVTLVCDAPDLMPTIAIDESWIESALTNLIANAMRFVREGGHVTVRVIDRGEALDLQVADDGVGIPEHDLERIFHRFSQADVATSAGAGTGIGLALVREAARMHGGDVRVESTLGKGSVFTVSLPRTFEPNVPIEGARNTLAPPKRDRSIVIAQLEDEAVDRRSSVPPSQTGPLAIVAEDNRDLRNYMADVLAASYRVHTASDGVEALELARKLHPDVIVSDIGMPRMDGYALCRALRADPQTRSTAVLLVTARDDLGSALEGFDAGANDYLPKPFHGRELLARVGVHVRMRHMIREMAARERLSTLGVLAASVAHQVRNPLTTLVAGLPAMRKKLGASVDARNDEMFTVMIDCAHRIERLTTDLLDVSRIDREEQGLFKPADGLRAALRLVSARMPEAVTVEVEIDDTLRMYGRAGDMNHVFLNLIDNAALAVGARGSIRISARRHENKMRIAVEDSGAGVDPQHVEHIFDPFYTTRPAGEGTGLGLAVARQVVDQHAGSIRVERSTLGGARFVVELPLDVEAVEAVVA